MKEFKKKVRTDGGMKEFRKKVRTDWVRIRSLYILVLPGVIFYILFNYKPIYGAIIAFQDYTPRLGISGSEWVGLANFKRFFSDIYFGRLMRNTLLLSVYDIIFGFPAPIILALLLNEIHNRFF